ncbi:methyltransferase [Actinophytocola algeriensis]|uniref:Ubiquinone/menaquinone biosynthesis C-methylase UbiE n=1 Tax=Actinophytocola algeriensis TaxID=1768010 RepID=A0A7W7Q9A8_9PSEU|nr:methyltransferase [Actinophytocola algeriensis]MBB4908981.1 ubiquinone/menaquinone biosynthesis C-methylase UbiE [Actinophytocola algeriensis]MBE1474631.1 ubiquinone/menaquinone biosynthesis C-methylase UbiE [Actinophytocola algeriensis]
MTERTVDAPAIVSAYDWGALGHVVDVGGGDGTLLIALLNEYPALSGTVVDLPATAEVARKMFEAAGLSDRAKAVAGDFLSELPDGAEGYLLSSVLHEWGDDDACAILRNCARAAGEDGAVFVIEPDGAGGRGVPELTACAESAGLVVAAVHTAGTMAIVELAAR